MQRGLVFGLLLVCIALAGCSGDYIEERAQAFKPLEAYAGKWVGTGWIQFDPGEDKVDLRTIAEGSFRAGGGFFVFEEQSWGKPEHEEEQPLYNLLALFNHHDDSENSVFVSMFVASASSDEKVMRVKFEPDKLIIVAPPEESETEETLGRFEATRPAEGKWTLRSWGQDGDGEEIETLHINYHRPESK